MSISAPLTSGLSIDPNAISNIMNASNQQRQQQQGDIPRFDAVLAKAESHLELGNYLVYRYRGKEVRMKKPGSDKPMKGMISSIKRVVVEGKEKFVAEVWDFRRTSTWAEVTFKTASSLDQDISQRRRNEALRRNVQSYDVNRFINESSLIDGGETSEIQAHLQKPKGHQVTLQPVPYRDTRSNEDLEGHLIIKNDTLFLETGRRVQVSFKQPSDKVLAAIKEAHDG